jgi:Na+/proline symporter
VRARWPQAATLSDAVGSRYGAVVRGLVSLLGLFYMGVYLAVELGTIAMDLQLVAGWSLWLGAAIVAACTIAYAAWGGVRSAIFADRLQIGLIVVLLVVVTAVLWHALGGEPLAGVRREQPELLRFTGSGWEMAGCLALGIVASNLFDNSFWARIFACRDERTVRRSFTVAGITIGLLLIPASLFGWWAVGNADTANPNVLPFALVQAKAPAFLIPVLVLALLLAMSTVSALFNGIVGVLVSDARALGAPGDLRTLRVARAATVALALPAVWVASLGYDATYLFFIANLVCAAAVVPVFLGLWAPRLSSGWVIAGFVLGLAGGIPYFPANIDGTATWLDVPGGQRFLVSYASAVGLSTLVAVAGARLGRRPTA